MKADILEVTIITKASKIRRMNVLLKWICNSEHLLYHLLASKLGEENSFETAVSALFDGCDIVCEGRAVTTIHSFV